MFAKMDDKNKLPANINDLPTLAELYEDDHEKAFKSEALNHILNQEPKANWICEHPIIKLRYKVEGKDVSVPYRYLPIDKVEFLLRKIFKIYNIEITGQGTSFNGVWVTVRIHYYHPVLKRMEFHDGIGAQQLQTKAGASPADMININNGAVSMAFPIAKTIAVKDACHHFGKLFGCDLNRRDTSNFHFDKELIKDDQLVELRELFDLKKEVVPKEDVPHYERIIKNKETKSYKKAIKALAAL